jgi:hypothetical protein
MTTLSEVYTKFGEVAEAAQLLETQLGNLLLEVALGSHDAALIEPKSVGRKLFEEVDRKTLGQLIKALRLTNKFSDALELELAEALSERNRLNHSFYRDHNFRRNTEPGRLIMLQDLERIHEVLIKAYVPLLELSGLTPDLIENLGFPAEHLNLNARRNR